MRVADFIINRLVEKYNIKYISLITGNGALVLNDAIVQNKNIVPICTHHEQDAADIMIGMSKYTNGLSVVTPTTGCASTNCITSLLSAYQDHVPILFLSGNVALNYTSRYYKEKFNLNLRKLGTQEADIIEIVKSITKYSNTIQESQMAKYELDKAIDISLIPPFGPVWLDLPADIGASLIEEKSLIEYGKSENLEFTKHYGLLNDCNFQKLTQDLQNYQKPLILAGNGIRLSNTQSQFKSFLEKYNTPAVLTYGAKDVLEFNSKYNAGIIGLKGSRSGNFALQNCDLLLILGACLSVGQVGYLGGKFAPNAKKIVVDISCENHGKNTVKINNMIQCELGEFFKNML